MREFVYLSEAKLSQFVMQKRRTLAKRIKLEGEVKIPGIGGLKASAPDGGLAQSLDIETIVGELEVSSRSAGWYTNEYAQVGQWVEFELPCNQAILPAMGGSVAVFADSSDLLQAGLPRLLLHGSAEHLVGVANEANMAIVTKDVGRRCGSRFDFALLALFELFEAMEDINADGKQDARKQKVRNAFMIDSVIRQFNEGRGDLMWGILAALEKSAFARNTATWLSGWARITCIMGDGYGERAERLLTATPLYVQYATPPEV